MGRQRKVKNSLMIAKKPYKKKRKRLGRGAGSGTGKTSGKGHKGQLSRSGNGKGKNPGFEGGQFPLYRRVPKRGFISPFKKDFAILNLSDLERMTETEIDPKKAIDIRLISRLKDGLKILGKGKINKAVQVKAHAFSASAKEGIEKAGGKALLITETKETA